MSLSDESLFTNKEEWNPDLEQVIKKEGEQSQSLFWLHNEANSWASNRNDLIQIPSIILASLTGFLSATSTLISPVGIGAMSLTVGILSTLNSYYKFSQRSESHRITAQLYLKTYKNIEMELALPVHQRANASVLLKDMREKMARISEIAPPIPSYIIDRYNKIFKDSLVSAPIITNGIDIITICDSERGAPKTLPNAIEEKSVASWPSSVVQQSSQTVSTKNISPKNITTKNITPKSKRQVTT